MWFIPTESDIYRFIMKMMNLVHLDEIKVETGLSCCIDAACLTIRALMDFVMVTDSGFHDISTRPQNRVDQARPQSLDALFIHLTLKFLLISQCKVDVSTCHTLTDLKTVLTTAMRKDSTVCLDDLAKTNMPVQSLKSCIYYAS
jgi:hypothetical protein